MERNNIFWFFFFIIKEFHISEYTQEGANLFQAHKPLWWATKNLRVIFVHNEASLQEDIGKMNYSSMHTSGRR
jgi:hypothetical protein